MNTLFFIFVVVADNIGSSRWVRKENPEPWRATQPLAYLFRAFESCRSLGYLFVFDKGKFREHFNFLDNPIVCHQLSHVAFVVVLRDSPKPKFTHEDITGFISNDLLGIGYLVHGWILGEVVGVRSGVARIILVPWSRVRLR